MADVELVWTADVDRIEGGLWLAKTEAIVGPYSTSQQAERVLAELLDQLPKRFTADEG